MTMNLMLATFAGAFIFPYLLRLCVVPYLRNLVQSVDGYLPVLSLVQHGL